MDSRQFHERLAALIDSLCETRALDPLRLLLPHYPMISGLTDEWAGLAQALKSVRIQFGSTISPQLMELVISLQHVAESALERRQ